MGEKFSGTCMKDTWTKPKWGRTEVEGGDGCGGEEMETTVLEQ